MEWVETTGRTVDEARDAALERLGVDDSDAEVVILSEPKAGLFGRLRGEARVRARVRPTSPRPKRTRSRRRSNARGRAEDTEREDSIVSAGVATADRAPAESRASDRSASTPGAGVETDGSPAARRRRRSRGRRGRGGSGRGDGPAAAAHAQDATDSREAIAPGSEPPDAATAARNGAARPRGRSRRSRGGGQAREATKEDTVGEVLTLEEQGEWAREFVVGLMTELGLQADVTVRQVDEETVEIAVDGEGLGLLIGPGGATLGAIQELTRSVVQKRTGGHSDRILVEVAGYRAKRAAALQRFTRQVADSVRASGAEQALEPMSASDRKVVHDTVNEIEGVRTRSEGEDPRRYIVISPTAAVGADEPAQAEVTGA